ncbi:hypothetical protein [Chryseobacterium indoltheticum]|uniref:hypothetical protein n=1 Tax=Chryseobacterium indoltheticum TaxID=254 RepID=UPI003F49AA4E
MKKLLFLSIISFTLLSSCDKIGLSKRKYYVEIDQNHKSEIFGSDFETKTEEIKAENINDAYTKAYTSFMIMKGVSEGTNTKSLNREILNFRLLDENKKDVTIKVSRKSKDSIHKIVEERTGKIAVNLKNQIKNHQNKIDKTEKVDSLELKSLRNKIKVEKDEFNENYFYVPKNIPPYRNQNYLGFYFSGTRDSSVSLHFLVQYGADDWLFVEDIQIKIDNHVYNFTPNQVETRVISGGIMEWFLIVLFRIIKIL